MTEVVEVVRGASLLVASPSAWRTLSELAPPGALAGVGERVATPRSTDWGRLAPLASDVASAGAGGPVVGLGGGTVLDAAKFVARTAGADCVLVPSVLSTTAWANPSAAIRRGGVVVHVKVNVKRVLVSPYLVAAAPLSLTRGGLADLLVAHNALLDWELARDAGAARMPKRAPSVVRAFLAGLERGVEAAMAKPAEGVVEFVAKATVDALEVCWSLASGRPLEGSEHFLLYALEEATGRSLLHGPAVATCTLACLKLRGAGGDSSPERLEKVYDRVGVARHPSRVGVDPRTFAAVLEGMPSFVERRGLPFSWWSVDDPFALTGPGEVAEGLL
ncbi:MAG: hypothetical protein Kow0069_32720 [Promethearchaeota archaeon]